MVNVAIGFLLPLEFQSVDSLCLFYLFLWMELNSVFSFHQHSPVDNVGVTAVLYECNSDFCSQQTENFPPFFFPLFLFVCVYVPLYLLQKCNC